MDFIFFKKRLPVFCMLLDFIQSVNYVHGLEHFLFCLLTDFFSLLK